MYRRKLVSEDAILKVPAGGVGNQVNDAIKRHVSHTPGPLMRILKRDGKSVDYLIQRHIFYGL